jgi:YD repeat-containing protein
VTLEDYTYLGLGTVVKRGHPQPGVDLTYIGTGPGEGGDQYVGLDRFGRVIDQRWVKAGSDTDRFAYGYDRDSNRLYRDNLVQLNFGEVYRTPTQGYDNLNQLTNFARGTLNAAKDDVTEVPANRRQSWALDAMGNWTTLTTDGAPQTRTHNQQNQILTIQGQSNPTYDANGNLTSADVALGQPTRSLVYDAWNRLVSCTTGCSPSLTHVYDALNRRVKETGSVTTDLYYSSGWQVLEEQEAGAVKRQYVWSPVYVDALIARDRDTDSNGSLEERLYAQHDANFNVTAF